MNSLVLLFLLFFLIALYFMDVIMRIAEGEVVMRIANGYLVRLNRTTQLVYVQSHSMRVGSTIELMHPWRYKLKHLDEDVISDFSMSGGIISPDGKRKAFLREKVDTARWIGIDGGREVFLDVDNDDTHRFGEEVRYREHAKVLDRYYEV